MKIVHFKLFINLKYLTDYSFKHNTKCNIDKEFKIYNNDKEFKIYNIATNL